MTAGSDLSGFDLGAYRRRLGYHGPLAPDLGTLRTILAAQAAAIPFENLDPLLGRPVSLALPALAAKLLGSRRGGYCFEQNTLLAAALQAIGFRVTRLAGRVRWMRPAEQPEGPRTHTLLRVDLDGDVYIADAGFGGHMLAAPVRLAPGLEQALPASRVRVLLAADGFLLQAALPAGWTDLYRFTLEPQSEQDYAAANWFTATHPEVLFTTSLLAERLTPHSRDTLFNRALTSRFADGSVRQRTLTDAADLGAVLDELFAITPPADPAVIWARLGGSHPAPPAPG